MSRSRRAPIAYFRAIATAFDLAKLPPAHSSEKRMSWCPVRGIVVPVEK